MGKIILAMALFCLFSTNSFSADKKSDEERKTVWLEFSFPWVNEGPFKSPLDQQQLKTKGSTGSFAIGWEPFGKKQTKNFLAGIFKNVGFSLESTSLKDADFPNYVSSFTYYQEYPVEGQAINPCYTYGQTLSDGSVCTQCSYSTYDVCIVTPRTGTINSRDSYIKYSTGSVAIGTYVPVEIAKKIALSAGVNLRFHTVLEGLQTDLLTTTHERSFGGVVKVGYMVGRWTLGFAGEKSLKGFKYSSKAATVTIRF